VPIKYISLIIILLSPFDVYERGEGRGLGKIRSKFPIHNYTRWRGRVGIVLRN
jgi:hypothetical protein